MRRFVTCGIARSFVSTLCTVDLKAGSATVSAADWTSTLSAAGVLKPALSRICSARAVSPDDCSDIDSVCVPTDVPTATATATNASPAQNRGLPMPALQCAARAAKLYRLHERLP